jgi:hypothetical protein
MAIKGARTFNGKPNIAKFESALHGSYAFVAVSLLPDFRRGGCVPRELG